MAADRIRVNAPGGDYDIIIQPYLLKNLREKIDEFSLHGKTVIVTNPTIERAFTHALDLSLTSLLPHAHLVTMPDGEAYKNLDTIAQLYADFVTAGLDRAGTVIALGGGVVGDAAGFAAATYMRGVRFIQIPTTLLAMVDSSVGGKVGVDLPQGKNLAGAFKQPDGVLIDPAVLKTLPEREWRCGMAEVIKHGLLADEGLLDVILTQYDGFMGLDVSAELVRRAVQVKVDVVQQDPYEKGVRAHLNLGHTFGHAIEHVSGYRWQHGEAVALGLIAAGRLSHVLGLCEADVPQYIEKLISFVGLPERMGDLDTEIIYQTMGTDKKRQGGKIRFVLLRGLCQPIIVDDVPKAAVIAALESLR